VIARRIGFHDGFLLRIDHEHLRLIVLVLMVGVHDVKKVASGCCPQTLKRRTTGTRSAVGSVKFYGTAARGGASNMGESVLIALKPPSTSSVPLSGKSRCVDFASH